MTNNTPINIKLTKLPSGKEELAVYSYGVNLCKGRTITEKDPERVANNHKFFEFLNDKAAEDYEKDSDYCWLTISDWRSWATSNLGEYWKEYESDLAKQILDNKAKYKAEHQ